MTEHEKTAIRLGKWTPGMKCANDGQHHMLMSPFAHANHDVPCPALTSDDIFAWLRTSPRISRVCVMESEAGYIVGFNYHLSDLYLKPIDGNGDTVLAALENALAKLPEAKQ